MTPCLVAQSYIPNSRSSNGSTDTDDYTLKQITVPGGLMNLNSKLVIITDWDVSLSNTRKILTTHFGTTNIAAPEITTPNRTSKFLTEIQNINSHSSQKIFNHNGYLATSNIRATSSVDTGNDALIIFKGKWFADVPPATYGTETITLIGYSIWHYPGAA